MRKIVLTVIVLLAGLTASAQGHFSIDCTQGYSSLMVQPGKGIALGNNSIINLPKIGIKTLASTETHKVEVLVFDERMTISLSKKEDLSKSDYEESDYLVEGTISYNLKDKNLVEFRFRGDLGSQLAFAGCKIRQN